jgi:hypothetical protein
MTVTTRPEDRAVRRAALFPSSARAAEKPHKQVTDVDRRTQANLRGVSR